MCTKHHATWLGSLVLVLSAATILACTCSPPPPPKQALQEAAAVFLGTVTEIGPLARNGKDPFMMPVTFRVVETWKGSNAVSRIVYTGHGGGDCGYRFVVGSNYLVYAYQMSATNLATSICSRTCIQSYAVEDLKVLGAGQKPVKK